MFIGEYNYSIDDKKRLAIPVKFRQRLGESVVITRGLEKCLFVYTEEEWDKFVEENIKPLSFNKADARGLTRMMLSGATDVSFDRMGRLLISDFLKEYAGLNKKVTLIGVGNRIEIWDEETWNKYKNKIEKESGDIAERLAS
jgi:MraZ protein